MGLAMAINLQKHLASIGAKNLCYTNRTLSRGAPLDALKANQCNSVSEFIQRSHVIFISVCSYRSILVSLADLNS